MNDAAAARTELGHGPKVCELLVFGAAGIAGARPEDDAFVVHAGQVLEIGKRGDLLRRFAPHQQVDAKGLWALPGFIDAHTHPAFAVGRAQEFDWRAEGLDYLEIASRGGGIHSSVRAVREASEEVLTMAVIRHFRRMLKHGTTFCEAKSGYGLSLEDETKSLRAIHAAAASTGMQVRATCLAAHMVPLEFKDRPEHYQSMLREEILPAVWEQGLASAADIFLEDGAFGLDAGRDYLQAAKEIGFGLRVHAEQFHALGGAELAAEFGAECVDHLEFLSDSGLEALALSGRTAAGLLPTVPHFLRQRVDAPARRIIQAGIPYFVATDFNPGSSYTASLIEAAHFARVRLRLSASEALHGITAGAAASLGVGERKGQLLAGFDADFLLVDLPDLDHLGYGFGENPVQRVFIAGREVE